MRATAILFATILLLSALPAAQAVITTNPNRFDLEDMEPGIVLERTVSIRNHEDTSTRIRVDVTSFDREAITVAPEAFTLGPHEVRDVDVRIELPANASGGRHDIRFSFVQATGPGNETGAVGQSAVLVPFIVHIDNLRVELLGAKDVPEGERSEAVLLVQNYLPNATAASLTLLVKNDGGREVARVTDVTGPIEPDRNTVHRVPIPSDALTPGTYRVFVTATHEENVSNTAVTTFRVGEKRIATSPATATRANDGSTALRAQVQNVGDVELPATVTFHVRDVEGNAVRTVNAEDFTLPAGASEDVEVHIELAAGKYTVEAAIAWPGGKHSADPTSFSVEFPREDRGFLNVPASIWAAPAGLLIAALAQFRRRDGPR